MNKAVWLVKRNYWIAGIGAIVSAFSFLAFTFLTVNFSYSLPNLLGGGTSPATSVSVPVSATELAGREGLVWVSLLLVLAVLGAAIVFMVRRNPFGSQVPLQVQAKWTAIGFVVAAALSALSLIGALLMIKQSVQDYTGNLGGSLGSNFSNFFHVDYAWGIGAYLFLAGLITIAVAGIMETISPMKMLSDAEMAAMWNYPQNQYNASANSYESPAMNQGAQPFADRPSQYGAANPYQGQAYPPASSGQMPPAGQYQQPPSQFPPYGQ
jgi:hypothetical protein